MNTLSLANNNIHADGTAAICAALTPPKPGAGPVRCACAA